MIKSYLQNGILGLILVLAIVSCSNKKNTFMNRQYHALTTHYNVYFNGRESLEEGVRKMKQAHQENYAAILPMFEYENEAARATLYGDMDRTIEKASKAIELHSITRKPKRKKGERSEKYKNFRKKKEYNNWIDDCYLLLGKAQFFKKEYLKAERSFKFILREYPDSKLLFETRLWLIKSMVDQEEYTGAFEQLYRLESESELPKQLMHELHCVRADLHIRKKEFELAIPDLEKVVTKEKKQHKKARYLYILAQLYQKVNRKNEAFQVFRQLIKINPSYEMSFNARISRALSYSGQGSSEKIRRELEEMLRDSKNTEYQDQIYYALAEMDMSEGNVSGGLENYWKSIQKSTTNNNQKALSFLKLGDYHFSKLTYKKAHLCYDSSMYYLSSEYAEYEELSVRTSSLTELVNNINTVEREDSLQMVARMEPSERDQLISGIIQKIVDKEQQEKKEQTEAIKERVFFNQNNMLGRNSQALDLQGNWYFYNPTTVGIGKSDFERKWGKRKLEDNWRRKNKSVIEISGTDEEDIADMAKEEVTTKSLNPKTKAYYLNNLPLTDSLIQISNEKIMQGLYQAALVYEEKLQNRKKALETFEELTRRFPKTPYLLATYYHCYNIWRNLGNVSQSQHYKEKIVRNFPKSNYAQALSDPDYFSKKQAETKELEQIYEQAYDAYANFYYYQVIQLCNEALLKHPENDLECRFLFLKALGIGYTQHVDNFKTALEEVLNKNPENEIKNTITTILSGLEQGAVPALYASTDMEQARQNRLLRNWEFDDFDISPKAENTPAQQKTPEEKGIYKLQPEEDHYFILLFSQANADPNKILFHVSKHNVENYLDRNFKVEKLPLNESQVMIIVKDLKNKSDALEYFNRIITDTVVYARLEEIDYRNFLISKNNFDVFIRNQDVAQYLDFYIKNYFDTNKKTSSTQVKKKDELVAASDTNKKTNKFWFHPSDNHKFVVVVPSKQVNINTLRQNIYSFDKDYQVVKEPYNVLYDMVIVSNLGTQQEAMSFLKKITEDQNIFYFKGRIKHWSFVISDKNFEAFYIHKLLDEYLKFFRENYIDSQPIAEVKPRNKEIKDGMYTYVEDGLHYFALVFPEEGVDIKKLEAGIRKYNTKNLKVEVRMLDKKRVILLVANMNSKKQAMIYFRAIVSNRNIFEPVEEVDYRNFIISQKNLGVFMQDTNATTYLNFFKKWYLQ